MALTFVIPGPLRELAGGRDEVNVEGGASSVRDALALLWERCPALRDRVMTETAEVRPHVNVFVDGESIRYLGGLSADVPEGAEIVILPAISGG
ncbi:MAG TPA: ubiquitin-like small modifier protein 1 [Thermoanaerobaculia bacterium]|nr:ubiquitin-like small modifier protein 1 [Thermoanaerobaculia bacterium]